MTPIQIREFLNDPNTYLYDLDLLVELLEHTNYEHPVFCRIVGERCVIPVKEIVESTYPEETRYKVLKIAYIDGPTGTGDVTSYFYEWANTDKLNFDTKILLLGDVLRKMSVSSESKTGEPLLTDIAPVQMRELLPMLRLICNNLDMVHPHEAVPLMLFNGMLGALPDTYKHYTEAKTLVSKLTEHVYHDDMVAVLDCAHLTGNLGSLNFWETQFTLRKNQVVGCELPTL